MSTASPARIEANRRNSALSTGPTSVEGKAASRGNSLKHGLTGSGIVSPIEDLVRIAEVAHHLRTRYKPITEVGLAMADHAAMLLVRLDRAGRHELALVADQVATAVVEFDQFRRDWADDLFDDLGANPNAIHELMRFPEGIDRLTSEWLELDAIDVWSADDLARVARISTSPTANPSTLRASIKDVLTRLEAARAAIDRRPIIRARQQAADLALFSISPEAILARKYEAATERAYHKAIKTLIEAEAATQIPEPTQTAAESEALASFSPIRRPTPDSTPQLTPTPVPLRPEPPVDRARRPDPKKLRESYRRKQR